MSYSKLDLCKCWTGDNEILFSQENNVCFTVSNEHTVCVAIHHAE